MLDLWTVQSAAPVAFSRERKRKEKNENSDDHVLFTFWTFSMITFCYNHTVNGSSSWWTYKLLQSSLKNTCALQISFKDPQNVNTFSSANYKLWIWEKKYILSQVRTANISVKVETLQWLWLAPAVLPTQAAPRWLSLPAEAKSFPDKPTVKMKMSTRKPHLKGYFQLFLPFFTTLIVTTPISASDKKGKKQQQLVTRSSPWNNCKWSYAPSSPCYHLQPLSPTLISLLPICTILPVLCLFPAHSVLCRAPSCTAAFHSLVWTQSHQMHHTLHRIAPTMSCFTSAPVGEKLGSKQMWAKVCAKQGQRDACFWHSNNGEGRNRQERKAQHGAEFCCI